MQRFRYWFLIFALVICGHIATPDRARIIGIGPVFSHQRNHDGVSVALTAQIIKQFQAKRNFESEGAGLRLKLEF